MTTGNTSYSINNTLPFLSEEMERTLRLRAWKDEIFREALIANPKGVIQRLFPQCFPNGKLAEELTIKVIEEGPGTCHIVLPSLLDEFPTPEIPEEEQLELLVHMGAERRPERMDASEKHQSQLPDKKSLFDVSRKTFERKQAEQQEKASEPLTSAKLTKDIVSLAMKDDEFKNGIINALKEVDPQKGEKDLNNLIQEKFPHNFPNGKIPEGYTIKLHQNTSDTLHFVLGRNQGFIRDMQQPQLNGNDSALFPSNSFNGKDSALCPSNSFNGQRDALCPSNSFNGQRDALCPSNSFNGQRDALCPSNSFNGRDNSLCPSNSFNGNNSVLCPSNSFNGQDNAFCPSNSFN